METETYELELIFKNAIQKDERVKIKNPVLNLDAAVVKDVMQSIQDAEIFVEDGYDVYANQEAARYVLRRVDSIFDNSEVEE